MVERSFTTAFNSASFDRETDEVLLGLVTIDHADLGSPIRVTTNNIDVTSNGDLFQSFPLQIQLPNDSPGEMPVGRIIISNIDATVRDAARSITSPADCTLEVIRAIAPNAIEHSIALRLTKVKIVDESVAGDLEPEAVLMQPWPQKRWTQSTAPGLFD